MVFHHSNQPTDNQPKKSVSPVFEGVRPIIVEVSVRRNDSVGR